MSITLPVARDTHALGCLCTNTEFVHATHPKERGAEMWGNVANVHADFISASLSQSLCEWTFGARHARIRLPSHPYGILQCIL